MGDASASSYEALQEKLGLKNEGGGLPPGTSKEAVRARACMRRRSRIGPSATARLRWRANF